MALTFYWRAENSTTLDGTHDYSANDTTAFNTLASFSGAAAYKGSYGILLPASTAANYKVSATDIINNAASPASSVGSAAFMIKFAGAIQTTTGLYYGFRPIDIGSSVDSIQTITGADDGSGAMKFQLAIGNVSVTAYLSTSEYCIDADNWYAVVVRWDIPGNRRRIEVYNTAGTLVGLGEDTSTNLGSYAPGLLTEIRWGRTAGHANDVYLDNMFVADAYDDITATYVLNMTSYTEWGTLGSSPLLLPHRSSGGMLDLSGNFRG